MGPGMVGGSPNMEIPEVMGDRLTGIPGEFVKRCEEYCGGPLLAHYFRDSQVISYVWTQMMQEAGIDVTTGVLEGESRELNRRFFTYHEKKRPYIILKWAQTRDGFIDANRSKDNNVPKWISDPFCRVWVHKQETARL